MPDGLKKEPALWNFLSGITVSWEKQEKKLTHLSSHSVHTFTPGTSHTTESIACRASIHLLSAHVSVRGDTSPPPAASPFRPNHHSGTGGQQCETSSGALTPRPGGLVGSDDVGKRRLFGSPDEATGLGRRTNKPLARAGRSRAIRRPASLADTAHADCQSSAEQPEADTTSSEMTIAARFWWNSVITCRRTQKKNQVTRRDGAARHTQQMS